MKRGLELMTVIFSFWFIAAALLFIAYANEQAHEIAATDIPQPVICQRNYVVVIHGQVSHIQMHATTCDRLDAVAAAGVAVFTEDEWRGSPLSGAGR